MASKHWMEEVAEMARARIGQSKVAMQKAIAPTVLRRPDTRDMVAQLLAGERPTGLPAQGEERLAEYLRETYGEAARHIFPHLGIEEPQEDPFGG